MAVLALACENESLRPEAKANIRPLQFSAATAKFASYRLGSDDVELAVDSTEFSVEGPDAAFHATIRARAAAVGAQAVELIDFPGRAAQWRVDVSRVSAASARSLANALESDTAIRFHAPSYRTRTGTPIRPLNQIAVLFKPNASRSAIDSFARANDLRLLRSVNPSKGTVDMDFAYPRGVGDPFRFAERLSTSPLVAYPDPNRSGGLEPHWVPTDPYYALQYYFKNSVLVGGAPVDIAVERVWDFTRGYRPFGLNVAVLAAGVQGWHEDFANTTVTAGYDGYGTCPACPRDPQDISGSPLNGFSHGTAVAGVLAASHGNAVGIAGVAPDVVVVPVRIFIGGDAAADYLHIRDAINWAWDVGQSHVMNNSWGNQPGTGSSPAIDTAIANAVTFGRGGLGTVVIFSAGNRTTSLHQAGAPGPVGWPATNPNVISVSAINRFGGAAQYAPRGRIDLVAPTSDDVGPCYGDLLSLDRMGSPGCNDGPGGNLNLNSTFGGTSAAAPQVSGVVALLLAREPTLTLAQARARLAAGADPWGRSDDFGAGKLNATFTVLPFSAAISGPITIVQPGTYCWTANATGGSGQYTYAWAHRNWGSSTWIGLSGGSTVSRSIAANTSRFQLRLTVGSVNRSLQTLYEVTVNAGGCSPLC